MSAPRKTCPAAVDLIARFEGCRLTAYQDLGGVWTVGYGHTHHARRGMVITPDEARLLLQDDLASVEAAIHAAVRVPLTDHEHGALVSLAHNIGCGAFRASSLLRRLNAGDRAGAASEFLRWRKVKGKDVPGLLARRTAEAELFARPMGAW